MKFIITETQLHKVLYKYFESVSEKNGGFVDESNEFNKFRFAVKHPSFTHKFFNADKEDPGDLMLVVGGDHSFAFIAESLVSDMVNIFTIRTTKILDIYGDWISNKFNIDINEVSIYPKDLPDDEDGW
jgi:NAD kinase